MAYFQQTGPSTYLPSHHVGGAWSVEEQHIAPALGLLAHVVEEDRDQRRDDGLLPARLSYDVWGTVPLEEVHTSVRVLRPGRTIELVEATLEYAGRTVATLRAWLLQARDTNSIEGGDLPRLPAPEETPPWDPTTVWRGGFIASVEVRRSQVEPGRGHYWVRTDIPLLEGAEVSALASAAGLLDIMNGMTVRADPRQVHFPNVDLTAHLFREPLGGWLGFDTAISFGPTGLGVTHSVLHDVAGPIGTGSQALTVRPG